MTTQMPYRKMLINVWRSPEVRLLPTKAIVSNNSCKNHLNSHHVLFLHVFYFEAVVELEMIQRVQGLENDLQTFKENNSLNPSFEVTPMYHLPMIIWRRHS